MEEHQRWRSFFVGLLVLVLLAIMFVTARPRDSLTPVERAFRDVLAPVEAALATATHRVRMTVDEWQMWRDVREENRRLRRELMALRAERQRLQEAQRENIFLRSVLGLARETDHSLLPAAVVARPISNWWSHITINRGRRDGVQARMPVLAQGGVVGYVYSVSERTADVLLLLDPKSALGAIVNRTSDPLVVEGVASLEGRVHARALVAEADLQEGDEIVTSGLSQIFPRGLPVGRIAEVIDTPPGRAAEAWVAPAVDFARLEAVAVLLASDGAESD